MRIALFLILLAALATALPAPPAEFSALRVHTSGQRKTTYRIFVRGQVMCTESSATRRELRDYAKGLLYVINDQTRSYSKYNQPKEAIGAVVGAGLVKDYKLLGPSIKNGQKCLCYEDQGDKYWLSTSTGLVVHWESPVGTVQLTKVKIGPQPDRYFRVPKGYRELKGGEG